MARERVRVPVGHRSTLLYVCGRAHDPTPPPPCCTLTVAMQIFLHIMTHCVEYVQGEHDPDPTAAAAIATANESSIASTRCGPGPAQRPLKQTRNAQLISTSHSYAHACSASVHAHAHAREAERGLCLTSCQAGPRARRVSLAIRSHSLLPL